MRLFINRDIFEIIIIISGVARIDEVLETEFLQSTMIEVVLEMFKLKMRKYSQRDNAFGSHTVKANWRTVESMLVDCLAARGLARAPAAMRPHVASVDFIVRKGIAVFV